MALKKIHERFDSAPAERDQGRMVEIWFYDEGRFGLKPCTGRTWAKRGKRPLAYVKPGYKNFYLFTAVNPVTGEEFTLQLPEVNTEMMNLYLAHFREVSKDSHIILVVDGAGWHRAKDLVLPSGIELLHLPPYSPELNPVERLWQWLRRHVCRNRIFDSLEELASALTLVWPKLTPTFLASLCRCNYL